MYPLSFEEYGLSPEILSGLADTRIEQPTPLQNEVLPAALQGKHLLVKTDAEDDGVFLIPALQKIAENGEVTGTQVLILTPSIERANKIDELIWAMGYHAQISSALLAMKGNKTEQEQAVLDGAPVIVANPGRLIEILEKNNFQLQNLKFIVIDEAHNMENFNLVSRVKDILRFVEGEPQALILSGNHNRATEQLAKIMLRNPELIGFENTNGTEASSTEKESAESVKVDLEKAEKKLEKASVKVVLNPEADEEDSEKKSSKAESEVDLEAAKEKLEEVEVEVVLNPEVETAEGKATEEEAESEEEANIDPEEAEKKLKKAGIKVVLKKDIEEQVEPVLANPILQGVELADPVPKNLEQGYINVPPRMKISTLMAHLESSKAKKVMVFAASKRTTDRLFHIIKKKNWGVVSVSSGLDDETYNERFAKFTSGEMRVCLIGGMEANKVEIDQVQEVINYDVPSEVEEYRYRAELVGNGKASQIISLVSKMDQEDIKRISEEVGFPPSELPLPVEVKDKKKKASPKAKSNGKANGQAKSKSKNAPQSRNKNTKRSNNAKRPSVQVKKKPKKTFELPRPTYDGLSGGREGKTNSGGVFGWVKKLFD